MSKMRCLHIGFIVFSLFIMAGNKTGAQTAMFDSLVASADTMQGIDKIKHLQEAARLFTYTSRSKGLYFAGESEKLIREMENDTLLALNYNLIGNLYIASGQLPQAEENYKSALDIYEKVGDYNGKATETHNLGIVYKRREDTLRAIDYFKQSLDARYETGNNRRIGDGLTTLGEIYMDYGEYSKSIPCLTSAIEYYTELNAYMRKFECYGFLADNFLSVDPSKSLTMIKEMEEIVKADTSEFNSVYYKIDFRLGQYHLETGNYLEAAGIFNSIDLAENDLTNEFRPIETLNRLSEKLFETGETEEALRLSASIRNIKRKSEDEIIERTISEYKTRLDFRSTEEDIERTEELNQLVLKRIHTERLLQYIIILIILILTTTLTILLFNYFSLRKDQVALSIRNNELNEANQRSLAYKESILRFRENKGIFFNIITDKLLLPFTDLTSRLTSLSEDAKRSFRKDKFLADLGNIYSISISIEKSLKRILVWSKLQRRKYEINTESINVNDYLHEMLPEILKMAVRQNIKVSFDSDPDLVVLFDRKSLRNILKIFIENSIDNSPKKSEIIIRSKKARNGGIISVTDFGSGIHPDIQQILFDIKKRDDIEVNNDYKRLGLGLLMSKHLAELNNSYISFESKLKKGSTFYLHIPNKNGRQETDI